MACQWVRCCWDGVGHCIVPCCLGWALHRVDNRFAIESVQQVQRAVLGYQPVYGHPGTGRSAGLILRDCVTRGEPASEQRNAVATRDVGERRSYPPPVNKKGHGLSADVDIHALALELEGGELASLRMFAGYLDGDVFCHLTPPVWLQNGGSPHPPPGRC